MDYKKILEGVVNIINTTEKSDIGFINICTYIGENCPELVEGEDEKIRKELISFFSERAKHTEDSTFNGLSSKEILAWLEKKGTPTELSEEEQNKFAKGVLTSCALSFIDYLDAHKYEGKMCVSNGECEDIENAFHNAMWDRLHRYYCKYIEKQGEQKPVAIPKFRVGDFVKDANYHGEPTYEIVGMDGECYICQYRGNKSMGDRSVMHFCFDNPYLRLVEQKPAEWSDEDEKIITEIINDIECAKAVNYHAPKENYEFRQNWLKSLKDRVLPQPTQKWSEEDDRMMNDTLAVVDWYAGKHRNISVKVSNWLKLLKSRVLSSSIREFDKEEGSIIDHLIAICDDAMCYDTFAGCSKNDIEKYKSFLTNLKFGINPQPQTTWKPSDEQMKVLDVAIMNSHLTTVEYDGLVKLREQLKKLREE